MTRGFTRILVPTDFSAPSGDRRSRRRKSSRRGSEPRFTWFTCSRTRTPWRPIRPRRSAISRRGSRESWHREADKHLDALLTPAERSAFRATTGALQRIGGEGDR